jgi:hypothetical protein
MYLFLLHPEDLPQVFREEVVELILEIPADGEPRNFEIELRPVCPN